MGDSRVGRDASADAMYSLEGSSALTASVDPKHRHINLVPTHALPTNSEGVMLAFFSTFGGAFLGIGFGGLAQGTQNRLVIEMIARQCAGTPEKAGLPEACDQLTQTGAPVAIWLTVGGIFIFVYLGVHIANQRKQRDATAPGRLPTKPDERPTRAE